MTTLHPRLTPSFNRQFLRKSVALGSCLFLGHALANTAPLGFPYAAGISVTGLTGDITTGYADAMVPAIGQPTQFFYVDPQGLFHNNDDYSAALGLGGRKLTEKSGILGAYVFGDYNHSPSGHGFWFVSPGIERLGNRIDFSANLYVPVGSDKVATGTPFGNQIGIYNNVSFAGHTEYDQLFNTYESVGIGADAEVGYRLPVRNNTKVYLGGYYFDPKNADSITGGTLRLEVPFTDRLNVNVSDGYDNFAHNTFKAGLTYNFVGRHTPLNFKGDLSERMVDPVHRNLIAVAGSADTAQPILTSYTPTGQYGVVMDHISFFLPTPTNNGTTLSGDGSYENPYIGLNQSNVDNANTQGNTNFFFNGGLGTYTSTSLSLTDDSIYGRQSYNGRLFIQPATGNNRPILAFTDGGGLQWLISSGDSNIVVSSVEITGIGSGNGIQLTNAGSGELNLTMNNVDISNFNDGLNATNVDSGIINLAVNNSAMNNNTVSGIDALNIDGGAFNITTNNSTFNNNTQSGIGATNIGSGALNITANNSTFNGNGFDGIFANNISSGALNVTATNSTFNDNGTDGIFANNISSGVLNVTATNSTFNDNGNYGIETIHATSVTYPGSTFSGNTSGDVNNTR